VYNDCLRLREECHAAGEKISDSEVQRRVITLAKLTAEREWLAQVPSVALVQACNDARRAYRNWFDSLSGKRKGRKIGHPVFRRKHRRQSIRLTRNGFSLRGSKLYVAKVGGHYGRGFHRIGRFVPTSQICCACGTRDGPKPLSVRTRTCAGCGAVHDRDVNAARNILAAGRADRLNACGGTVRPPSAVAGPAEAGTHRSVA
jgi:transposase